MRAWWNSEIENPQERAKVGGIVLAILGALLPAIALEWLARYLLRRVRRAIAAWRMHHEAHDTPPGLAAAASPASTASPDAPLSPTASAAQSTKEARSQRHAALQWILLQRLPAAALQLLVRLLPLAVFVAAANVLMSILTDEGTPQDSAISTLIDIYTICRTVVIASGFILQPDAPALRLLRMHDSWAVFVQRWVIRIAVTVGSGAALVETASALGLSDAAYLALVKLIALAGHVLLSIMILQCRASVAAWVRERSHGSRSLALLGDGFVDAWAGVAVFIVMALWFVWALDVQHGYRTLLHLCGASVGVLIGARLVSIVVFGALSRLFHVDDGANRSLVNQHAYRYYPWLRRVVYILVAAVTLLILLQIWNIDVAQFFARGTIGHRLVSALVTILVAALAPCSSGKRSMSRSNGASRAGPRAATCCAPRACARWCRCCAPRSSS